MGLHWGITNLACTSQGRMNLLPSTETLIEPETRLIVLGTRDWSQELIVVAR